AEAEALILEKEGDVCVRFYQRTDGTVLTADCPVGRRRTTRRRIAMAASAAGLAIAAAACARKEQIRCECPVVTKAQIQLTEGEMHRLADSRTITGKVAKKNRLTPEETCPCSDVDDAVEH